MIVMANSRLAILLVSLGFGGLLHMPAAPSLAQAPPKGPPAAAPGKPPAKAPAAPAAAPSGEAQLRQRIDQLEEQLTEMQTIIGTLESLARSGVPAAAAPSSFRPGAPAASAMEDGRVDGLETQIRAMAAQLERLSEQVRALEGGRGAAPAVPSSAPPLPPPVADGRMPPPPVPGFGSTTVRPSLDDRDAIGRIIGGPDSGRGPPASAAAAMGAESPKQHYEIAYGMILQQDYAAAQASFEDFLARYPRDALAGNAQYWLGETFFVRGQFKPAAQAFLKGYQTYGSSPKAPDSLFKLALSLDRMGQKNDACATFGELLQKFPSAPASIKGRAQTERQRLGCA